MDNLYKPESKKKNYSTQMIVLGAVILAIGVLHFVIQMTFVRDEKARLDEPETQTISVPPAVEMPQPKPEINEAAVLAEQPISAENTQIAPDSKPVEPIAESKSVEIKGSKRKVRVPETKYSPAPPKTERIAVERTQPAEKPRRETKAERIRRAERILTGV